MSTTQRSVISSIGRRAFERSTEEFHQSHNMVHTFGPVEPITTGYEWSLGKLGYQRRLERIKKEKSKTQTIKINSSIEYYINLCGFTSTGILVCLSTVVILSLISRKSIERACARYIRLGQVIKPAFRLR
jgi:hypothetical protein